MTTHPSRARRLLFCGLPAASHLDPMMPLALAAREAGHEVVFATGDRFVRRLQGLGFKAHRAGRSIEEGMADVHGRPPGQPSTGRLSLDLAGRLFLDVLARQTADDLLPLMETLAPDLVVFEETDVGAAVAASLVGLPAVSHALGPALPAPVVEQVFGSRAAELWAHYGRTLMPIDSLRGEFRLDIYPASLQEPAVLTATGRIPIRPVPWNEPGPRSASDLQPESKGVDGRSTTRVYLTLGRSAPSLEVMESAIQGLSVLDVEVIVALGGLDLRSLGEVPERVRVERYVDQAHLLSSVDLVVHHGGSASLLGALAFGLPQLLLPCAADHLYNADAVARAGVGRVLRPGAVSAASINEAACALLSDGGHRPAIDAVRIEIAGLPHPREVLPRLLDTIGRDRTPPADSRRCTQPQGDPRTGHWPCRGSRIAL